MGTPSKNSISISESKQSIGTSLKDKLKKVYKTLSTENKFQTVDCSTIGPNKSFRTIDKEFESALGNLYSTSKSLKKFELNQMYYASKTKPVVRNNSTAKDYASECLEEHYGAKNNNKLNTNIEIDSSVLKSNVIQAPKVKEKYLENNKLIQRFFDNSIINDKNAINANPYEDINDTTANNHNKFKFFKSDNNKIYEKNSFDTIKTTFNKINNEKLMKFLEN